MAKPRFSRDLLHPRFWPTWIMFALWFLVVQLPYPLLLFLARGLALLLRWAGGSRRHIVSVNLRLCFPQLSDSEREKLLRDNYFSMAMALFETGMAWFWPHWRLRRIYTVRGLEHLPEPPPQGVIMMALHFTTLDIGAAFMNIERKMFGMYRPHKNPVYDYVQRRGRERHRPDIEAIPRKDVRAMLRALRDKCLVWYAPDQDYGRKQSVFAPFFDVSAASVTATARFAQMGKAKVVPFVQRRLPGIAGYEVTIYPPWENYPTGDDVVDATRVNRFVEERILEQPEQYLWAHRRFKTRPEGEPGVY